MPDEKTSARAGLLPTDAMLKAGAHAWYAAESETPLTVGHARIKAERIWRAMEAARATPPVEMVDPRTGHPRSCGCSYCADRDGSKAEAARVAAASLPDEKPIPMLLFCPSCGLKHIDEPDERTPQTEQPS
jgi:hypothetical protein